MKLFYTFFHFAIAMHEKGVYGLHIMTNTNNTRTTHTTEIQGRSYTVEPLEGLTNPDAWALTGKRGGGLLLSQPNSEGLMGVSSLRSMQSLSGVFVELINGQIVEANMVERAAAKKAARREVSAGAILN